MQSKIIGIVLMIVGVGIAVWLGAGLATGKSVTGVALGFVLFSLPFFAVGAYFLMRSGGEIVQQTKADKERAILDAVTTRGRVGVADLAIENDSSRDEVRTYIYDLIGKGLFTGYVNWDKGELVSAEAAQIKEGQCPNCGGAVELAGKGLVRCPFCGTETYLSGPTSGSAPSPMPGPTAGPTPGSTPPVTPGSTPPVIPDPTSPPPPGSTPAV